jgi:general stress protein YciG
MPRGPKGEKRPADVIGNTVKVMRLATGEEPEDYGSKPGKNQAAAELGRKGGKAGAVSLTKKRRAEIARKAAQSRWKQHSQASEGRGSTSWN